MLITSYLTLFQAYLKNIYDFVYLSVSSFYFFLRFTVSNVFVLLSNSCTYKVCSSMFLNTIWALFNKFLTPGLTYKLCNPLDDWLDWLILTNHRMGYIIRRLIRKLKVWWIRAYIKHLLFIYKTFRKHSVFIK